MIETQLERIATALEAIAENKKLRTEFMERASGIMNSEIEKVSTPLPVEPPADLPPVKKPAGKAPTAKQIKSFVATRLGEGHKHEVLKAKLNSIAPSIDDLDENGRRQFMAYLQDLRVTDVPKAA